MTQNLYHRSVVCNMYIMEQGGHKKSIVLSRAKMCVELSLVNAEWIWIEDGRNTLFVLHILHWNVPMYAIWQSGPYVSSGTLATLFWSPSDCFPWILLCPPPSNKYITSPETCRKDLASKWDIYHRCEYITFIFCHGIVGCKMYMTKVLGARCI
jgi:hypothetical protein